MVWDSSRLKTILLGFPVFQVTKAGNTSLMAVCFAPKPPPILGLETRTMLRGIPSAFAMIRLQWNTICVELTTLRRP